MGKINFQVDFGSNRERGETFRPLRKQEWKFNKKYSMRRELKFSPNFPDQIFSLDFRLNFLRIGFRKEKVRRKRCTLSVRDKSLINYSIVRSHVICAAIKITIVEKALQQIPKSYQLIF